MATVPDHWCNIPELSGLKKYVAKNLSIPTETTFDGQLKFSQCFMYDFNYTNTSNISSTNVDIVPCKNGWFYDIDNDGNSVVSEWNLVCDNDFSVILALILLGASGLIGNYIFGYIQDGMGRKPAYFIYLLIQCIFGIATAFAKNYVLWAIFRIGVGFTVPAILGTPYVLVTLSIIVWAIRNWRWMSLATTLPFFTLFFHWWALPESPRWLLAQGRYEEAERVLHNIARVNGKTVPSNFITNHRGKKMLVNNNPHDQKKYGIKDLFSSRNLRWKTSIVTFLWFTNTSVYVGLSYYAPALGGDEFLNFFLAGAVELPTYLFLWPAMERLGRRWTLCISMIIGGTSCLATFLVQNGKYLDLQLFF
ncbi:hypothetical protein NQ314_001619 [Rhamnusium bicolor]|uniref:Organic cation transporter protein n=1 Tax=Rhamnusium bicolor TaxID=1586634 RepID=A0AAV8ZRT7_9CUCU|nr:hypothetical protein NQ314_001619 [Rhamnusium bicolor]